MLNTHIYLSVFIPNPPLLQQVDFQLCRPRRAAAAPSAPCLAACELLFESQAASTKLPAPQRPRGVVPRCPCRAICVVQRPTPRCACATPRPDRARVPRCRLRCAACAAPLAHAGPLALQRPRCPRHAVRAFCAAHAAPTASGQRAQVASSANRTPPPALHRQRLAAFAVPPAPRPVLLAQLHLRTLPAHAPHTLRRSPTVSHPSPSPTHTPLDGLPEICIKVASKAVHHISGKPSSGPDAETVRPFQKQMCVVKLPALTYS